MKATVINAFAMSAAAVSMLVGSAEAASIGVNFGAQDNWFGWLDRDGTLATGESAGVVSQTNWNQYTAANATGLTGLIDSAGSTVSGLAMDYTSNGVVPGEATTLSPMLVGHLESPYAAGATGAVEGGRVTIYLTNIPYASYDVYVYAADRNTHAESIYWNTDNSSVGSNPGLALAQEGDANYTAGVNYVKLTGMTSSSLYLVASDATNTGGSVGATGPFSIAGIQIVDSVPEPTSLGILFAGGFAVLARRRASRLA